jgi:uncharacterized protein DUF4238
MVWSSARGVDAQRRRAAGDRRAAMNRNGQSRRRQNVSFQTIIVGHSPIRRRQLAAEGATLFSPALLNKNTIPDSLANMSKPKTEHYVPQFILRQFLVDECKEQVAVYDKHKDRGFTTSIKNVMAENRFHDFRFQDWIMSFEPIASKIEDLCLPTYQCVIETRCLDGSPQEKADLGFLMAFQMLRTKAARASFQEIGAAMTDKVEAMGHRVEDILGWEPQTEDTV